MTEKQLNASDPWDAVRIIDQLTVDMQLSRRNAIVFHAALATLANAHAPKPDVEEEG